MKHDLCECGHDRRIHDQHGQPCVGCDCKKFTQARRYQDRRPTMRSILNRIEKRMGMPR